MLGHERDESIRSNQIPAKENQVKENEVNPKKTLLKSGSSSVVD